MLIFATVLLIAALSQCECQRYGAARSGGYASMHHIPSRCPSLNKPCRLKVSIMSHTGTVIHQSEAYTCSCNLPLQCPQNWNNEDQAVTRTLITESGGNITFSIMFCTPVAPRQICEPNQASLELSGYLNIPNDLESYNCRCGDGLPLQLRERRIQNYKYYHSYVCNSDKPTCPVDGRCVTITPSVTTYHCKCPVGTSCESDGVWSATTEQLHGTCRLPGGY